MHGSAIIPPGTRNGKAFEPFCNIIRILKLGMIEQIKFELGNSNEVILRYPGKRGARGEKRAPRRKRTREEIERQNQTNKVNNLRRKIVLNFREGDLWCTLKYPAGTKKTVDELKEDWKSFSRELKKSYRKAGHELKFIYRMEIGKNGGAHIHILVNRIPDAELAIDKAWIHGRVYRASVYKEGGCEQLADYIAKKDPVLESLKEKKRELERQTEGQIGMFDDATLEEISRKIAERSKLRAFGCSRNLIRPEDVKTVTRHSHWTLRALFDGDLPKASEGFAINKDSVYFGVNPFTGLSYVRYTEERIEGWKDSKKPPSM